MFAIAQSLPNGVMGDRGVCHLEVMPCLRKRDSKDTKGEKGVKELPVVVSKSENWLDFRNLVFSWVFFGEYSGFNIIQNEESNFPLAGPK